MSTLPPSPPPDLHRQAGLAFPIFVKWDPLADRQRPVPNPTDDLGSYIVHRHEDIAELSDDQLREQISLARFVSWRRSLKPAARRWLNERTQALRAELVARGRR